MNDMRQQRGMAGKNLAAKYLEVRGLKILARNLRCKAGELDLVCLDGGVLAIVEVRQRGCAEFGGALDSVTWTKRRKIIRTARYFLQRHVDWRDYSLRFDVIAVQGLPDGLHDILWVKDAFVT